MAPTAASGSCSKARNPSSGLDARVSDEVAAFGGSDSGVHPADFEFRAPSSAWSPAVSSTSPPAAAPTSFTAAPMIYMTNEALNAGMPFTNNGTRQPRPDRQAPARLRLFRRRPGLDSQSLQRQEQDLLLLQLGAVSRPREPLQRHHHGADRRLRNGDLSAILGRNLGTDFAGRAIMQNAIYDPDTASPIPADAACCRSFPNNIIPQNRFDPVATKIMAPAPEAQHLRQPGE